VNAVAPGLIQTDFSAYFWEDEERRQMFLNEQPIARLGQPEDIGGLALFLASDEASFITGQVFVVDGGATA
jgi:dehydrogenase/reductase SDR family protein 4